MNTIYSRSLSSDLQYIDIQRSGSSSSQFGASGAELCIEITNTPHGLNDFSQNHGFISLGAHKPRPPHYKWVRSRNIPGEAVNRAIHMDSNHVNTCSSVRVAKRTSSATAQWLQSKWPGSKLDFLDCIPDSIADANPKGRPKQHNSENSRKIFSKRKRAIEKATSLG
jgi:hypothetical protein